MGISLGASGGAGFSAGASFNAGVSAGVSVGAGAGIGISAAIGAGIGMGGGGAETPFTAFNFKVEIEIPDQGRTNLCQAAFAECDGLEMNMQVKTIQEGGNNNRQIHLPGPMTYGQLSLKRGMTTGFDLWDWFEAAREPGGYGLRAQIVVVMLASFGSSEGAMFSLGGSGERAPQVAFLLDRCLPVKLRAPSLNAKDGMLAIEEMLIAYETLGRIRA